MRRSWKMPALLLAICAVVIGVALCIKFDVFGNLSWPWEKESTKDNGWVQWSDYHYYNDDMAGTQHPHHFGPDRYALFQANRTEEDEKKYRSEHDYIVRWTREDFYTSIETDPMLAAGCIYYAQKTTGEDFLGTLEGDTDEVKANYAHYLMRTSPEYWKLTVTKFEDYLDKNYSFNVVDINGEYTSSSYQLPGAATFDSSAPRMIWESSTNRDGHWFELVQVKGKDSAGIVLHYRMECGYQFPTEKFTSGGEEPPVTPVTPRPTPTPTPSPSDEPGGQDDNEPKKDKSKDPVNQGNAQQGGGQNLPTDGTGTYQATEPTVAQDTVIYGGSGSGSRGNAGQQTQDDYPDTTPGTKTETTTTTNGGITTTKKETTTTSIDDNGTIVRDVETEVTVTDQSGHSTTVTNTEKKFDSPITNSVDNHSSNTTDSSGNNVVVTDDSLSDGEIFIP